MVVVCCCVFEDDWGVGWEAGGLVGWWGGGVCVVQGGGVGRRCAQGGLLVWA